MAKISVVINTLNEEENLPKALLSIKDFADEIVVVDMMSTDKTQEIAEAAGARVFEHKQTGYVEPARNFAISKAVNEWVLVLDADEELTTKLANKLKKITENPEADYFRLPRKNVIFGKWMKYSRWWPDYNVRFFRKGFVSWNEIIHAVPTTKGKGMDLEDQEVLAILHNHYQTIEQYLGRMDRYTSIQSKRLIDKNYKFIWKDLIRKPSGEFISRYFFGEGYKDGLHGLSVSLLQAFSEIILYLKIWQKEKFMEQTISINEIEKEYHKTKNEIGWWVMGEKIKSEGKLISIATRIKRRSFKIHE